MKFSKKNIVNVLLVDNDLKSQEKFLKLSKSYLKDKMKVRWTAENVNDAINQINKFSPDLVYIDPDLNSENGFNIIHHFKDFMKFQFIIVSKNENYAVEALKYKALDYLVKPINMVDLISSVKRYENKMIESSTNNSVSTNNLNSEKRDSIAFPSKNGFKLEKVSSIVYCEAKGNYCQVYLNNKGSIMVSKTLKKLVEMIDSNDFFRIHKTFYLNMNYISSYNRSENLVELNDGKFLPVSVRKNEPFVKKLKGII